MLHRSGRQASQTIHQATKRKDALTIALEFERVEQQARRGTMTRVQVQKVVNETVEKILEETIVTPSAQKPSAGCSVRWASGPRT
jgi:hypothetical protein